LNIANVRVKTNYSSWPDLAAALIRDATDGFFWRGMSNSAWCLTASIDRFMAEERLLDRSAVKHSLEINFKENMQRIGEPFPDNEDEFWALAQHLGLPTPMLDWSKSPWVAAYFAVTGSDPATPPGTRTSVIYRISDSLPSSSSDLRTVRIGANPINRRLRAQEGLFTEGVSEPCLLNALNSLRKLDLINAYTFDPGIAQDILLSVRGMMISDITMFPDVVGAVREARARARSA
jgi:FRG domain